MSSKNVGRWSVVALALGGLVAVVVLLYLQVTASPEASRSSPDFTLIWAVVGVVIAAGVAPILVVFWMLWRRLHPHR